MAHVCVVVSWDTWQIRALFNPSEISFGKSPSWHSLLLPSSAEGEVVVVLKWSGHFCGRCEYVELGDEGLKQLVCPKKKVKNYGRGISTLIPVPEL